MAEANRVQGTVTKWIDEKGYGFISVDRTRESAFIHYSEIPGKGKRKLNVGERVEFTLEHRDRGLRAVALVRL